MELLTLDRRTFPTALYRLRDVDGILLYVGITSTPIVRIKQHAKAQPWWPDVDCNRITLEWHSDRTAAERAERAAIEVERPVYNIEGSHPDALYARLAATGRHEALADVKRLDESVAQLALRRRNREAAVGNFYARLVDVIAAGMPLSEAARRSGYSREYLSKLYAKLTGHALGQWQHTASAKRAARDSTKG